MKRGHVLYSMQNCSSLVNCYNYHLSNDTRRDKSTVLVQPQEQIQRFAKGGGSWWVPPRSPEPNGESGSKAFCPFSYKRRAKS